MGWRDYASPSDICVFLLSLLNKSSCADWSGSSSSSSGTRAYVALVSREDRIGIKVAKLATKARYAEGKCFIKEHGMYIFWKSCDDNGVQHFPYCTFYFLRRTHLD
ncbi:hypothetical protein BJ741DRAFT_574355 [Chytriomyces cf. hyalinus JEL632]|nr:hypothetical protein BJ741DRAFT_574355 [Chytriomyces cf. hyalinus JEL632]